MIDNSPLIRGAAAVDLTRKCNTPTHILEKATGSNVRLLQVEFDIFDDHPDVAGKIKRMFGPEANDLCYAYSGLSHAIHATAVSSLIIDPNYGVAPQVDYYFTGISKPSCTSSDLSSRILFDDIRPVLGRLSDALENDGRFGSGDIISISLQSRVKTSEGRIHRIPIDADRGIRDELLELDKKGLIVFIAAGNSKQNLDSYLIPSRDENGFNRPTKYSRAVRESPAIKVGYTGMGWSNRNWSNSGEHVKFFAPTGSMRAACYNYDAKERRTDLIDTFSGGFGKTSAATPIIASIAARLQGAFRDSHNGQSMNRDELVSLMKRNSIPPNGNHGHVGVFPVLGRGVAEILDLDSEV